MTAYPPHFAVVIDDITMKITQVIRGDDHVPNTPGRSDLSGARGAPASFCPRAHDPRAGSGETLQTPWGYFRDGFQEMGYLPEALVNYLVRLGWSHGDQEIFSREELIEHFSLENVGPHPRLRSGEVSLAERHYLRARRPESLVPLVQPFPGRPRVSHKPSNISPKRSRRSSRALIPWSKWLLP